MLLHPLPSTTPSCRTGRHCLLIVVENVVQVSISAAAAGRTVLWFARCPTSYVIRRCFGGRRRRLFGLERVDESSCCATVEVDEMHFLEVTGAARTLNELVEFHHCGMGCSGSQIWWDTIVSCENQTMF
jgi:hypothetical protein